MLYLIILIIAIALCWLTFNADAGQGIGVFIVFIVILAPFISYFNHAGDLGTIRAQKSVIHVYEQRVEELSGLLKTIVPEGRQRNPILMNADSPIRGIVDNMSKANEDLAKARVGEAESLVSIAKRKAGPFHFIVKWFGED